MKHEALPEGATVVRWDLTPERYVMADGRTREWREQRGSGAWENEPDVVEWRKPGSALPRMIVRNNNGALCGYVGLPPGHALHGAAGWGTGGDEANDPVRYERVNQLEAHGGITYANECAGHICHVPRAGEPEHVWWLGFDCSHSGDMTPGLRWIAGRDWGERHGEKYRDVAYVIREVESLAAQLEEAGGQ